MFYHSFYVIIVCRGEKVTNYYVELINKKGYNYKFELYNQDGKKKKVFNVKITKDYLLTLTEDIIYLDNFTRSEVMNKIETAITYLILENLEEYDEFIKCQAANTVVLDLSDWIEKRIYDYLNSIYSLNEMQLEEIKKFYKEDINLNLIIKRNSETKVIDSEMLNAEEMEKVRISVEQEWLNVRKSCLKNNYSDDYNNINLEEDGTIKQR